MGERLDFLDTLKARQTQLDEPCDGCEEICEGCSGQGLEEAAETEEVEAKVEEVVEPKPKVKKDRKKRSKVKPKVEEKTAKEDEPFVVKPSETNRKFTQMIKERSAPSRKYLGRRTRY